MAESGSYTIGKVVKRLQAAYPDLSISKVRYLEDEGLLNPQRTPSGYRMYSQKDVDRLEYILYLQKTRFLPLSVIKDQLEKEQNAAAYQSAVAAGVNPETLVQAVPAVSAQTTSAPADTSSVPGIEMQGAVPVEAPTIQTPAAIPTQSTPQRTVESASAQVSQGQLPVNLEGAAPVQAQAPQLTQDEAYNVQAQRTSEPLPPTPAAPAGPMAYPPAPNPAYVPAALSSTSPATAMPASMPAVPSVATSAATSAVAPAATPQTVSVPVPAVAGAPVPSGSVSAPSAAVAARQTIGYRDVVDPEDILDRLHPLERMPELCNCSVSFVRQLVDVGVISLRKSPHGRDLVDGHDLSLIRICDELQHFGIGPKNLRQYVIAANRESMMFEQALMVYTHKGGGVSVELSDQKRAEFNNAVEQMLVLTERVRDTLIRGRLAKTFAEYED